MFVGRERTKKKKKFTEEVRVGEREIQQVTCAFMTRKFVSKKKKVMENCPCCHQNAFVTQTTESAHADRTTGRKHVPGSGREVRGGQGEGS